MQNAKLGKYTEEQMSAIKLVIAFGREEYALSEYGKIAKETQEISKKTGINLAFKQGLFPVIMLGTQIFAWFMGRTFVIYNVQNVIWRQDYNVAHVMIVYYSIIYGTMMLFQLMPIIPALERCRIVAKEIFDVIERDPWIGSHEETENAVEHIEIGKGIQFENVKFKYPTAPEDAGPVLEKGNFTIRSGTSTAIVGPSGSGKSTIVQLLNRFYDPESGTIKYGSDNIKTLKISQLREMIGWVGQEPVLIIGTIRENLSYGNANATVEDMREALHQASALAFVEELGEDQLKKDKENGKEDQTKLSPLEKGLDTYVGTASILNLSGGQKQRIAIARAIIKKPQILVLDEATSALDPKSENEV